MGFKRKTDRCIGIYSLLIVIMTVCKRFLHTRKKNVISVLLLLKTSTIVKPSIGNRKVHDK